jgi:PII-like signaling protein
MLMLVVGPATKITIHVNQDTSSRRDFLHAEILTFLHERGVSGATVMKPHAGFGSHHHVHTSGAGLVEGEHLPVRIEFIESTETVDKLLPELYELVTDGLIEATETTILKIANPQQRNSPRA